MRVLWNRLVSAWSYMTDPTVLVPCVRLLPDEDGATLLFALRPVGSADRNALLGPTFSFDVVRASAVGTPEPGIWWRDFELAPRWLLRMSAEGPG